ncbi:MAG TPA: AAA family ATPase [Ktedonobacteraceae bacterium]|nr:AAA family ATPase [Ktedonobacteraceae bacterium]
MQQVVIRLLGPPEIRCREQVIKLPRRRSRALLFYMVCTHTPQPRERLLALLCGEMDEASARHTFKTLLAEVRARLRSIDPSIEWITGDGDLLTLNPLAPLWLDTEVFETATSSSLRNLAQAVKLYRGPFLDGFFLRDSPGFDDWARSTRDHFHQLYLSALRRMETMHEAEGQLTQAIACAQMLVQADPLSEEAHTCLMRLYWKQGERVEALRQYEKLCTLLAQELTIKPMASTTALYEQIMHDNRLVAAPITLPSSQVASSLPNQKIKADIYPLLRTRREQTAFIGRGKELIWLRDALIGPQNSTPLILISGESGCGKTRLVEESIALYCASWRVFRGACQEIERAHPYHAIVEALRQGLTAGDIERLHLPGAWLSALSSLLPDLLPGDELFPSHPAAPTLLADALVAIFHQLASPHKPVALVIDDLHWADTATLALLGHLVRHARPRQTFFLCTCRDNEQDASLKALREGALRQGAMAELSLYPLSPQETDMLTRSFLAAYPALSENDEIDAAVLSDWCYRQSDGNPLLALEALRQAVEACRAGKNLPEYALSAPARVLLERSLRPLSQQAVTILEAASILGFSFDFNKAARMAGLERSSALLALQELSRQGIIAEASSARPGHYIFSHRLLREYLLANLSATHRSLLLQYTKILSSDILL